MKCEHELPQSNIKNISAWNVERDIRQLFLDRAILNANPAFNGKVIDIGCGQMKYKDVIVSNANVSEYVGVDLEGSGYSEKFHPDILWDGVQLPFEEGEANCAMLTEVLEHVPEPNAILTEVLRVLSPGGFLLFTVPVIWPFHDVPNDEYRYTPFSLRRTLTKAGYTDITVYPQGGWNASLAQILALWVRRKSMSTQRRAIFQKILLPIVKLLLKYDQSDMVFSESSYTTGLWGFAYKPKF